LPIAKVRYRKSRYGHVMYKLLYPSIRVRTAPPVSVRVRTTVSVSFNFTVLHVSFAIADLCDSGPESLPFAVPYRRPEFGTL